MGIAGFAGTFAAATLYMAKPGTSAMAKPSTSQSAQSCAARPDGTQNCQLRSTSSYVVYAGSGSAAAQPTKTQGAALTSNPRSSTPMTSAGIERGGFGSTGASTAFRASAGG